MKNKKPTKTVLNTKGLETIGEMNDAIDAVKGESLLEITQAIDTLRRLIPDETFTARVNFIFTSVKLDCERRIKEN